MYNPPAWQAFQFLSVFTKQSCTHPSLAQIRCILKPNNLSGKNPGKVEWIRAHCCLGKKRWQVWMLFAACRCSQKQQTQVMLDQVSKMWRNTKGPNCKKIYIKLQTRELDKKLALLILQQKKNIQWHLNNNRQTNKRVGEWVSEWVSEWALGLLHEFRREWVSECFGCFMNSEESEVRRFGILGFGINTSKLL